MSVQAVFFDMGGTIETFWQTPELRRAAIPDLAARLRTAGIDLQVDDDKLYELVSSGYKRYHKESIQTMEELPPQRVWSEFILAEYPVDPVKLAAVAEDLMYFIENRFYHRKLRKEVPAVLAALAAQGIRIGLISNVCCRNLVPENLARYGIRHYFDPIILSSEYGRRKPDPSIFHHAARLANVPTSACAYVGDRIARDILGARRAGFSLAVQIINPFEHGEDDHGAVPDAVINRMDELPAVLEKHAVSKSHKCPSQQGIRALIFDAGDILYHRPKRGREFHSFLSGLGLSSREIPPAARHALKLQAYHGEINQEQFRAALLGLYGISDPFLVEQGKRALETDDNSVQIFKGVPGTLKKLKQQGFLLAIITDTANPLHVKLSWFERGGFGHVWDSIISSQEVGVQKPHPAIYSAALQQLGLAPAQAVFVGHSPEELEGAQAVGMKTVAFNYGEAARADHYIQKFSDLLKVAGISANNGHQPG